MDIVDYTGLWLAAPIPSEAPPVATAMEFSPLRAAQNVGYSPRRSSGRSWRVYTDRILLREAIRKHKRREDEELLILLGEESRH